MPLLKRGEEIHPQTLFESSPTDLSWWVAHVRSRQEKRLARHLVGQDVPFYLPLYEKRVERSGRRFQSYLPVFPGYVFLRGFDRERVEALRSGVIVRFLPVADPLQLQDELTQLRRLQLSGASLVPCRPISPGDPVRIVDGPFRGTIGTVLRESGRLRLVVSVSMLHRSVAVQFDRDNVNLLPGQSRAFGRGASGFAA